MRSFIVALSSTAAFLFAVLIVASPVSGAPDCNCMCMRMHGQGMQGMQGMHGMPGMAGMQDSTAAAETDPVCNMSVDAAKAKDAKRVSEYKGKTYYFCNDDCKKTFDANPEKYVKAAPEKTK